MILSIRVAYKQCPELLIIHPKLDERTQQIDLEYATDKIREKYGFKKICRYSKSIISRAN